jgi:hypothetical protein
MRVAPICGGQQDGFVLVSVGIEKMRDAPHFAVSKCGHHDRRQREICFCRGSFPRWKGREHAAQVKIPRCPQPVCPHLEKQPDVGHPSLLAPPTESTSGAILPPEIGATCPQNYLQANRLHPSVDTVSNFNTSQSLLKLNHIPSMANKQS